jgi:hypothetical protein
LVNLILAVFWLAVAAVIFALPSLNPNAAPWRIPQTDLSMGWFALCLFFYNLVRWWTTRRSTANRTWQPSPLPRRRLYEEEAPRSPSANEDDPR